MKSTEKDQEKDKDTSAAAAGPPVADEQLVRLKRDGEEIAVHPSCVEAHVRKGWKAA